MNMEEIIDLCLKNGVKSLSRRDYRMARSQNKALPSVDVLIKCFGNFTNFKDSLLQKENSFDNIKEHWRNAVIVRRKELFNIYKK